MVSVVQGLSENCASATRPPISDSLRNGTLLGLFSSFSSYFFIFSFVFLTFSAVQIFGFVLALGQV